MCWGIMKYARKKISGRIKYEGKQKLHFKESRRIDAFLTSLLRYWHWILARHCKKIGTHPKWIPTLTPMTQNPKPIGSWVPRIRLLTCGKQPHSDVQGSHDYAGLRLPPGPTLNKQWLWHQYLRFQEENSKNNLKLNQKNKFGKMKENFSKFLRPYPWQSVLFVYLKFNWSTSLLDIYYGRLYLEPQKKSRCDHSTMNTIKTNRPYLEVKTSSNTLDRNFVCHRSIKEWHLSCRDDVFHHISFHFANMQ